MGSRDIMFSLRNVLIIFTLLFLLSYTKQVSAQVTHPVSSHIKFSVIQGGPHPISGARIIVINQNGKIIATGFTNAKGTWTVSLTVEQDPRFPKKRVGTVTAIAIAKGFNEEIVFDIPVNQFPPEVDRETFVLEPIHTSSFQRNEPHFRMTYSLHRHTAFDMLDYYAKQLGLPHQEENIMGTPWSPN